MKTAILLTLLLLAAAPTWAGAIIMDFTVHMDWRYDLATQAMDPMFQPLAMNLQAIIDDERTGSIFFPPATTRILFRGGPILSPLSGLVDMGYDISTLTPHPIVEIQDQHDDWHNATWTAITDDWFPTGGFGGVTGYSKSLQYTNDPPLSNPATFSSADLYLLLSSHLNKQYQYREDIRFLGGGFQHHGVATLTNIRFESTSVPEPSTGLLTLGAIATLCLGGSKKAQRR